MKLNRLKYVLTAILLTSLSQTGSAAGTVEQLQVYRQQGATQVDQNRGRQLWNAIFDGRGCTSCHGSSPRVVGKHAKTAKPIQPMALSVNPKRYRDGRKIEKWFLRNCKWTFGRPCSLQEKADILTWLTKQ